MNRLRIIWLVLRFEPAFAWEGLRPMEGVVLEREIKKPYPIKDKA